MKLFTSGEPVPSAFASVTVHRSPVLTVAGIAILASVHGIAVGLRLHRGAGDRRRALRRGARDREGQREAGRVVDGHLRTGRGGARADRAGDPGGDLRERRAHAGDVAVARRAEPDRPDLARADRPGERDVRGREADRGAVLLLRRRRARHHCRRLRLLDEAVDREALEVEALRVVDREQRARDRGREGRRKLRGEVGGDARERVAGDRGVGVVAVADPERPDVADAHGAVEPEPDAREERAGVGDRPGHRRAGGRGRAQHVRGDLERVDVEGAVARALDLRVRRLEVDRAAERLVADVRVEEAEEVRGLVDALRRRDAVVAVLVLEHRGRREDEPGGRMLLHLDLQVVVDAVRQARA